MFKKAKEISDDKVNIAVHTYELVDKHIRKLDSDLAKFESEMKVYSLRHPICNILVLFSLKAFASLVSSNVNSWSLLGSFDTRDCIPGQVFCTPFLILSHGDCPWQLIIFSFSTNNDQCLILYPQ